MTDNKPATDTGVAATLATLVGTLTELGESYSEIAGNLAGAVKQIESAMEALDALD
jgi:hypothetical protein